MSARLGTARVTPEQYATASALLDLDEWVWGDLAPHLTCSEVEVFVAFLRAWGKPEDYCASVLDRHAECDDEGDAHYQGPTP